MLTRIKKSGPGDGQQWPRARREPVGPAKHGFTAATYLVAALLLTTPSPSIAQSVSINEYAANGGPQGITLGPDGAMWFAEYGSNRIGRITTAGVLTEYPIPTANACPTSVTAGPDGALWFNESGRCQSGGNLVSKIGRITTAGVVTNEYPTLTSSSIPGQITKGPDGALWFTELLASKIGRITTAGVVTEYPTLTPSSWPTDITHGPDGALWFTEGSVGPSAVSRIGRITTAGVVTEYPTLTSASLPQGITAGPDGALWFTEQNANQIGRITTAGVVTEYPIPTSESGPYGITVGPDGALWFTESGVQGVPQVQSQISQIGRITTAGVVTNEYATPTSGSLPSDITLGPDGALWFTETTASKIGRAVPVPAPPQNLVAVPTASSVTLTWTASTTPPAVVGYNVYRGTTPGGPYPTQLNSTPINGTTYTDETVQAGQTYYYVVTAIASDGVTQSAFSNEASATVPSGGGGGPAVSLSPLSLTFGSQPVGTTSASQSVTLTNAGNATLIITSLSLTGTNAGDYGENNTCGSSVATGGKCTFFINFTPSASGTRTASLTIADNAITSPQMVSLTGTGIQATTTTAVTSSANPSAFGQSVTFTANVTPQGPITPTGTVSFNDGTTAICTGVTLSSGGALCTISTLAVGQHSITAVYSGDTNFLGSTSPPLSQTVNRAPAITSASSATFTVGTAGSFTVTATGSPAPTLSESGALPSGVTFNTASGVVSGTPAANTGGTYPITITASNGVLPNATQSFTLAVDQAPAITSASNTTCTLSTACSFTVTATGFPAPTLSESGALPSGVTFNTASGVVSGTPAANTGGTYPITFTASNGILPNATQNFTLTVDQAPAITSASNTTCTLSTACSFTVAATGFPPPTFSETGALPSGVTLSAAGVLGGTPAANTGGTYPITITASNGVLPNATQNFTLTINQALAITSANNTTCTVNAACSFTITATGSPAPTLSESGVLPSGVNFNAATGVLSGTPAANTGGTYPITITASNGVLPNATQNFTLTVDQAPAITSANNTTCTVSTACSFTVTVTGFPAPTLSESGALPGGVTFNTATGELSGAPAANTGGSFPITITASNGVLPNATQDFTLTLTIVTPSISLTGLAATLVPTQNTSVGVSLSSPATTELDGTLTLTFISNAAGTGPNYIDPMTQFLAGGTTMDFAIPAGSSTADLPQGGAIQQGTTAGTITVTLTQLTADGINVLPQPNPSLSVTVPRHAPVITSGWPKITNQTATGFTVQFNAYSTPRDLSNVTFTFQAASGAQLQGTSFSYPLDGTSWFSSTQGQANGGTFWVSVPFTFSGDNSALGSVTVTLSNSVGSSSSAAVAF